MIRYPIILLLALIISACAPKSIQTESGKAAWYANQVTIRLNEVSAAIIQLNAQGTVSDADTRVFGTFAKSALETLGTIPQGWEKTVQTGWIEAKSKLPPSALNNPIVMSAIATLEAVLTLLNPVEK